MTKVGRVYLSFLGGGAPLHSSEITAMRELAYPDLVAHDRLVRLAVEGLGPVTVGTDAHGNRLFDSLHAPVRMAGIPEGLAASRMTV